MVYVHDGWTLYYRDVVMKGVEQTIYYFSKRIPKSGEPCDLPYGYTVFVNKRTGLPFLKEDEEKKWWSKKIKYAVF